MVNSGHKQGVARKIIISGLKCYERKLESCASPNGQPLHRTAKQSGPARHIKKLLGKSNWFKQQGGNKNESGGGSAMPNLSEGEEGRGGPYRKHILRPDVQTKERQKKKTEPEIKTRSVLFVNFSKGGTLAKGVRGVLQRLEPLLGFRVKVQEKGGSKLQSILSNKHIWKGGKCGRHDCHPCKQGGDKVENCFKRNVLYESRCNVCNPDGDTGLATLKDSRANPSIYVGETSRSLKERSLEHHNDYRKNKDDSHMLKHASHSHNRDNNNPMFNQYIVGSFQSSLSRQIAEAVRIQLRGATLNSAGVYNRCKLTRMVVDTDWDKRVWEASWESKKREQEHLKRLVENGMLGEEEEEIMAVEKRKKNHHNNKKSKKRKVEDESGVSWGEGVEPGVTGERRGSNRMSQCDTSCTNNNKSLGKSDQ